MSPPAFDCANEWSAPAPRVVDDGLGDMNGSTATNFPLTTTEYSSLAVPSAALEIGPQPVPVSSPGFHSAKEGSAPVPRPVGDVLCDEQADERMGFYIDAVPSSVTAGIVASLPLPPHLRN